MQLFETPTVTSDINGHHVKDQDGKTIQSFPRSPEGLKASKQYMYKHHKNLSVSQKKASEQQTQMQQALAATELPTESKEQDKTMTKLEEMYENALNETITITTNTSDNPDEIDGIKVNAQDADANELMSMLKMAGIGTSNEPAYQEIEFEPDTSIAPMDAVGDMSGLLDIVDLGDEGCTDCGCDMDEDTDYANAPDEVYGDADLQMSMSGGLNSPSKSYHPVAGGDNPMALESDGLNEYWAGGSTLGYKADILRLHSRGLSDKEIAAKLGIDIGIVQMYVSGEKESDGLNEDDPFGPDWEANQPPEYHDRKASNTRMMQNKARMRARHLEQMSDGERGRYLQRKADDQAGRKTWVGPETRVK